MEKINCVLDIDIDKKNITVNNLRNEPVIIDCSTDIDLTEVVAVMAELIDGEMSIDAKINKEIDDEKIKIVIDTLNDIIEKFNNTIKTDKKTIEDDSDFWETGSNTNEQNNDLPF